MNDLPLIYAFAATGRLLYAAFAGSRPFCRFFIVAFFAAVRNQKRPLTQIFSQERGAAAAYPPAVYNKKAGEKRTRGRGERCMGQGRKKAHCLWQMPKAVGRLPGRRVACTAVVQQQG